MYFNDHAQEVKLDLSKLNVPKYDENVIFWLQSYGKHNGELLEAGYPERIILNTSLNTSIY